MKKTSPDVKSSSLLTIVSSLIAVAIATGTFYINYVRVVRDLRGTVTGFRFEDNNGTITMALSNPGNTPASLIKAGVLIWMNPMTSARAWRPLSHTALLGDFRSVVLKPGEVQVVDVAGTFDEGNFNNECTRPLFDEFGKEHYEATMGVSLTTLDGTSTLYKLDFPAIYFLVVKFGDKFVVERWVTNDKPYQLLGNLNDVPSVHTQYPKLFQTH